MKKNISILIIMMLIVSSIIGCGITEVDATNEGIKDATTINKTNNADVLGAYVDLVNAQLPTKEELNAIVDSVKEQKELKDKTEARRSELLEIHNKAPEDVQKKVYEYWHTVDDELASGDNPDYEKVNEALDSIESYYNEYNKKLEAQKKEATKKETAKKETTNQEAVAKTETEATETVEATPSSNDSVYLNVSNIEQNPELPTGCEAVAATIVLNYYGAGMSKTEMVDNYLPYSDSPYSGFVGSPYEQPNGHGHWCTAAPIVTAMNGAIAAHGMGCTAVNISGSSFDTVLSYVSSGHPVVFWGLENMSRGYHTLALIGYDKAAGVCYFADPLKSGIQTYSIDASRNAYNNRGKQAVIVQ